MSQESDFISTPQFAAKFKSAKPSHIGARHIGKDLSNLAFRKAAGRGIGNNTPVSSFVNQAQFQHAIADARFPTVPKLPQLHSADQFCAWGLSGNQNAFQALLHDMPNPAQWTISDLNARGINFFISKEVIMVQGSQEATTFGVLTNNIGSNLLNQEALAQLGANSLQEAVSPSCQGWVAVSKSTKFQVTEINGREMLLQRAGKALEALKIGLLLAAVVMETTFFALEWKKAENKIVHVADYAAQVALIVGGFCACEAVSTAMITASFSAAAAGVATLGVGLVFSGAAIGLKILFSWIQAQLRKNRGVYHYTLDFHEMIPLFEESKVFTDTLVFDTNEMQATAEVFDQGSMYAETEYFGAST